MTTNKEKPEGTIRQAKAEPTLWRYAQLIYKGLRADSKRLEMQGKRYRVHEGAVTRQFSTNHIATPYYGPVMRFLKEVGAVKLLYRGNKDRPSRWVVFDPPTRTKFDKWYADYKANTRKTAERVQREKEKSLVAQFEQRLNDLIDAVGTINIPKAFVAMDKRLARIEKELGIGDGQSPKKRVSSTQEKKAAKRRPKNATNRSDD